MKTKVIRIDIEVFEALQKRATPLVDVPNDVLRELLGLKRKQKHQSKKEKSK